METIPADVADGFIFCQLTYDELCGCRLVNREWYRAINNHFYRKIKRIDPAKLYRHAYAKSSSLGRCRRCMAVTDVAVLCTGRKPECLRHKYCALCTDIIKTEYRDEVFCCVRVCGCGCGFLMRPLSSRICVYCKRHLHVGCIKSSHACYTNPTNKVNICIQCSELVHRTILVIHRPNGREKMRNKTCILCISDYKCTNCDRLLDNETRIIECNCEECKSLYCVPCAQEIKSTNGGSDDLCVQNRIKKEGGD